MRSPRCTSYGCVGSVFTSSTLISPRYCASMSPGVFRQVTPWFSASPERGRTNPACPSGIAIAMPVGTSARPPAAAISVATAARRS